MEILGKGKVLRIFLGENTLWESRPLHEVIVEKALEEGLAGATVTKGDEGFGASSRIRKVRALRSNHLPVMVEIADKEERIAKFIPILEKMVDKGMVYQEDIEILIYK
jgi:PII-like signaling protein